jgi:hypothetical protein
VPGGSKLCRQQQAVSALLQAPTVSEAAAQAGVSVRTIWNWLADDSFRSMVATARGQVLDLTITRLASVATEAVDTLATAMRTAEKPSDRIAAARAVLGLVLDRVPVPSEPPRGAVSPAEIRVRTIAMCQVLGVDPERYLNPPDPRLSPAERLGLMLPSPNGTDNGRE